MTHGAIPYLDLYDHKGPLLFFLYALGFLISDGKVGIYLVEVVFFAISLWSAFQISRLFVGLSGSLLATLFYIAWCWGTLQGGGTNEEFSQPFAILPTYWALRHFFRDKTGTAAVPLWLIAVTGFCGGAITMIRMNNSAVLVGVAISLLIQSWRVGKLPALAKSLGLMTTGFFAAIIPFIIYFHLHGGLDYFIQGCFTHNLLYALQGSAAKSMADELFYLASVAPGFLLLGLVWREHRQGKLPGSVSLLLTAGALVGILSLHTGEGYAHYYQILAPVYLISVCLLIRYGKNRGHALTPKRHFSRLAPLFVASVMLLPYAQNILAVSKAAVGRNLDYHGGTRHERARQEAIWLAQHIPAQDRDKVWGMNLRGDIYIDMSITPCFRYFTLQSAFGKTVPKIQRELTQWLETSPPLYIVGNPDPATAGLLSRQYEAIAATSCPEGYHIALYRRKP